MYVVIKMKKCFGECNKTKSRTDIEKKDLIKRLNIIEGQIKGIKQMILDNRYCDDVLIQVSASKKSLKSFGNQLLKSHLSTCFVEDLANGKLEVIDEIVDLFDKLNK